MSHYYLIIPVLLPIIFGGMMLITKNKNKAFNPIILEGVVILNSIIVWAILLTGVGRDNSAILFSMGEDLKVFFRLDGMGMVFAGLVSFLWPLATLYAFEYMEHADHQRSFFALYTMTYGVTLGIAMSGNLVSLYVFYEMLTLVTFPLVLHYRTKQARRASRIYLYYSIGGAACAFMGLVFVLSYGTTTDFKLGGVLNSASIDMHVNILLAMYVLAFFGFGVKAAVFPVQKWLPAASVAPTPVTALLHAVAVVKSGAFAILRLTYYSYGADFLRGTWAQYVVIVFVLITIVYGSTMAAKEIHFKKRLAYSTISNLSYVLLGGVMMCPAGLVAALTHLVFHAIMKICAFFSAGAVMHRADKNYVYELDGLGWKMPITFTAFTVAGLSLIGIPFFAGFISKWNIVQAALSEGGIIAIISIAVLLYSAFMTAIYTLTVVVRAFFPAKDADLSGISNISDPSWKMILPFIVFMILIVYFGLFSSPLISLLGDIAKGVL